MCSDHYKTNIDVFIRVGTVLISDYFFVAIRLRTAIVSVSGVKVNPSTAKLFYCNFHSLEVVSR